MSVVIVKREENKITMLSDSYCTIDSSHFRNDSKKLFKFGKNDGFGAACLVGSVGNFSGKHAFKEFLKDKGEKINTVNLFKMFSDFRTFLDDHKIPSPHTRFLIANRYETSVYDMSDSDLFTVEDDFYAIGAGEQEAFALNQAGVPLEGIIPIISKVNRSINDVVQKEEVVYAK